MKKIGVSLSPHQRRRLHNGHPVRVKKGEGIMLVNPGNFDTMSRTFLRGKAKEIRLTPEEVLANHLVSPEAHNYNRDEVLQPPSIAPQVAPINSAVANITGGRISNAGGPRGIRTSTMAGMKQLNDHLQKIEDVTGLDLGDQLKAGLGKFMANTATAAMNKAGLMARKGNMIGGARVGEEGMARIREREAKQRLKGGRIHSQVGVAGNLLDQRQLPPALQSQPFSANWAFANQTPPAYHKFSRGV